MTLCALYGMDNNYGMDDNILHFPVRRNQEILPERKDLEAIALSLSILAEEEKERPRTVEMLKKYPLLLGEYLMLPIGEREALEKFCSSLDKTYFDGLWNGNYIQRLTDNYHRPAARIARKYRFAQQLLKMFQFYLQGEKEVPFHNTYLRENPELQRMYGTLGATLVTNVRQNNLEVRDIVAIVAAVQPEILNHYCEPGYRSNVRYHPSVKRK